MSDPPDNAALLEWFRQVNANMQVLNKNQISVGEAINRIVHDLDLIKQQITALQVAEHESRAVH